MIDRLIVGGGVIGLLTAYELLKAGESVALVERGEVGRESSWAGGGILSPLYPWRFPAAVNDLAQWSMQAYPDLARELAEASGIDPQWTPSGMLVLDAEEAAVQSWITRYTPRFEWRVGSELEAFGRGFARFARRGLWLPEIAQIRNPRLVKALRAAASHLGLEIYENQEVTNFRVSSGRVEGVDTHKGPIRASTVIVCSGAWTSELLGPWRGPIEVEPVKGQMLMFRAEPGLIEHMVLHNGHYVIPRRDGHILAGSTLEHTRFDKSTSEEARQRLYAAATSLFPLLGDFPVERHWAGLRPGTEDGVPYICAHPEVAGLYVNAGHYRNGVVLAPASARLMADMVLGRETILDVCAYAADHALTE